MFMAVKGKLLGKLEDEIVWALNKRDLLNQKIIILQS